MKIGQYQLENSIILAPMAGVTDRPFRQLCKKMGAGLVISEMVSANPKLLQTKKSLLRLNHEGEPGPIVVQIAGGDADILADFARYNADRGADMIDINMGCPAKKVCNKAAGSALMQEETLVAQILTKVVKAVDVPVTLKIRTGWAKNQLNAIKIAKMAENAGIQSLAIHGRTRECMYQGPVDYQTIKTIKQQISIPVVANGDINTPEQAKYVLDYTGADAIMIGRGAQGNPWIFKQIDHYLKTGNKLQPPSAMEKHQVLTAHLNQLYNFYGEFMGLRIARKHVGWYLKTQDNHNNLRQRFNQLTSAEAQLTVLDEITSPNN